LVILLEINIMMMMFWKTKPKKNKRQKILIQVPIRGEREGVRAGRGPSTQGGGPREGPYNQAHVGVLAVREGAPGKRSWEPGGSPESEGGRGPQNQGGGPGNQGGGPCSQGGISLSG
jgi:hypothetical protein